MGFKIDVYKTSNGKCPFEKWMQNISNPKVYDKIRVKIERLAEDCTTNCKGVKNGVYELKIYNRPGFRIYFSFTSAESILILCAGTKQTQKRDIIKAKLYLKEYKNRGAHYA